MWTSHWGSKGLSSYRDRLPSVWVWSRGGLWLGRGGGSGQQQKVDWRECQHGRKRQPDGPQFAPENLCWGLKRCGTAGRLYSPPDPSPPTKTDLVRNLPLIGVYSKNITNDFRISPLCVRLFFLSCLSYQGKLLFPAADAHSQCVPPALPALVEFYQERDGNSENEINNCEMKIQKI